MPSRPSGAPQVKTLGKGERLNFAVAVGDGKYVRGEGTGVVAGSVVTPNSRGNAGNRIGTDVRLNNRVRGKLGFGRCNGTKGSADNVVIPYSLRDFGSCRNCKVVQVCNTANDFIFRCPYSRGCTSRR